MCVRILRRECDAIGYDRSFTIYDTDDQKRVLTAIIKNNKLDDKVFDVRGVCQAQSAEQKIIYRRRACTP